MPEISRPRIQTTRVEPSRLGNNQPVAGTAAVGQAQQQLGAVQQRMADEFFQVAQKSFKESLYNNAISESTQKFNQAYQQRLSQRVDENGNPTYTTLASDVQKIAKEIREDQMSRILDADAQKKFDMDFSRFTSAKVNQSYAQARSQHIDYSRASLNNALDTIQKEALSDDPQNINMYTARASDMINSALQGGILSAQESEQQKRIVMGNIRVTSYSNFIDKDPFAGLQVLQQSPEELGLEVDEHKKLQKYAKAAVRDQQRQVEAQKREEERAIKDQQALITSELELNILKGVAGEREIEEQSDLGNINPFQRVKLLKQVEKERIRKDRAGVIGAQIDDNLSAGLSLHEFSSKQIKDHYNQRIQSASPVDPNTGQSQPLSMKEKAKIAADYTRPITSFQNELEFNLKHGDSEQALDALAATSFVDKKQSVALERMDAKSRAIASMATSIIENTDTDANRAIEVAREAVLNKDDVVFTERSKAFSTITDFRRSNMKETVKEIFDLDSTFGFGGKELAPGTSERVRNMLRQAYIDTGDKKAAMEVVRQQVKNTYGVSEFNEEKGIFDDTEVFMFMPPEKAFPGIPVDDLKADLNESLTQLSTPTKSLSLDNVRIQSDELTRANPNQISYGLYTVNEFGQEITLVDDSGQPLRWAPDYSSLANKRISQGVQAARAKRQQRIDEKDRIKAEAEVLGTGVRGLFKPREEGE